jgi:hypothetical protein
MFAVRKVTARQYGSSQQLQCSMKHADSCACFALLMKLPASSTFYVRAVQWTLTEQRLHGWCRLSRFVLFWLWCGLCDGVCVGGVLRYKTFGSFCDTTARRFSKPLAV